MRRLAKIAVCYILSSSALLLILQFGILNIRLSSIPENTWLFRIADLEQRLCRYRFSGSPTPVIIGSSYSSQLGEFGAVKNLAVRASNVNDHEALMRLCRHEDTILYLCSIRESLVRNEDAHDFITRRWVRKQIILKQLLLGIFDELEPDSEGSDAKFQRSDPEYSVLCDSIGIDDLSAFRKEYVLWQIRCLTVPSEDIGEQRVDVAPFARLCELFPNMVIVLHPSLPLKEVPNTSRFAQEINSVVQYQAEWESKMMQSGLPVYNLSSAVPAQHFVDLSHLTDSGQLILKEEILSLLPHIERVNVH